MIKFPLKVVGKVVETSSKVVTAQISVIDADGTRIRDWFADPEKVEEKISEARVFIEYVEKMDRKLKKLVANRMLDEIA